MKTQKITVTEVILRILIILLVFTLAYFSKDSTKQIYSVGGFLIAFLVSVYLHKHFFPFIILSILCYLMASTNELWNASYTYLPVTKILWSAGNIFLPIGIINFAYRLFFKYKIVEHEEND